MSEAIGSARKTPLTFFFMLIRLLIRDNCMVLTFDEIRFLGILLATINMIVIIYVINFYKHKNKSIATEMGTIFSILGLLMFDMVGGILFFPWAEQLSEETKQFIIQAQVGVSFAFIFAWISIFMLISHHFRPKYEELSWYSLLINHMTILLIVTSFVIDIIPSGTTIPLPIMEYSGIIITIIVAVIIDIIRRKSK